MASSDYTVHIVDDEEAVRKSLAFLLTMSGHAVRLHDSATSFLAVAAAIRNGCLVTDLRMPDMSGVELLRKLQAASITIPSIVITGHGDVPMAVEAMKAGALDFIEKPFDEQTLLDAIERAAAQLNKVPDTEDADAILARLAQLTEREHQIMYGVVQGLANKSIAFDLKISPRTVEVHRANVMTKMQAKSLPELVRMALSVKFGSDA
ncbi:response regulator FixJ [Phyllobacterium myrsinacearum]|uniref:Two-component system response regulator FixJ n=1 Tax=Phyllobacterium myrsinacearum TaxID=28101 RepID=A0A839ENA5_9HYPH|nr:response regulator FixJ [Phyllobacterium myrsinacearum]MBA8882083.1 two-component system response regulator FixJ [Phyllobacterium myrsinacearum]